MGINPRLMAKRLFNYRSLDWLNGLSCVTYQEPTWQAEKREQT